MPGLSRENRAFLTAYAANYSDKKQLADLATEFVKDTLSDRDYGTHLVTGRAKSLDSLRMKLLLKGYTDPASELTDQIGVRVITYYGSNVDTIVNRLRSALTVDRRHSLDKRQELEEQGRFGYRSVHVVGALSRTSLREGRWKPLRGNVIEIQVRSLLDHVWAEVEHELGYKSGVQHEVSFERRFSALAGMLELLEGEFLQLRAQLDQITDGYREAYRLRRQRTLSLDAARLTALLEVLWPDAPGWRHREKVGAPLPVSPSTCVQALDAVGISTARDLEYTLNRRGCQTLVESYASNAGLAAGEVSHLAVTALMVGYRDPVVMHDFFGPLLSDTAIRRLFAGTDTALTAAVGDEEGEEDSGSSEGERRGGGRIEA